MPKYKVRMARVTWLTATVDAENEDDALEMAYDVAPGFSAVEGGWGSPDWYADADEWMPVDEFFQSLRSLDLTQPGLVISVVQEDSEED